MQSRGAWVALSLISGALMIVLGALFLARPGLSLATVILLFGWFTIVWGVVEVVSGLLGRTGHRAWSVVLGLLAAVAGVAVLAWPGLTGLTLVYLIAAWALVSGVADLVGAFARGVSAGGRVWLVISGLLSVAAGILLFARPLTGALAVLWVIGVYLVALGILRIIFAFAPTPASRA